jgi:hypothetical protein
MNDDWYKRKEVLTAYVRADLKEKVTIAAELEGRSMSSFIAEALIDRIAKTKSGEAQGSASE